MKKLVLLDHLGKPRLGNQLWNYAGIYAYCLEKGYKCANWSFEKYYRYFKFNRVTKIKADIYRSLMPIINAKAIVTAVDETEMAKIHLSLSKILQYRDTVYLRGHMFRNQEGIMRHHLKLIELFQPTIEISEPVRQFLQSLREKYETIIGLHLRQGDYREYEQGKFFFSESEVRSIIDKILQRSRLKKNDTCFLICSDEKVQTAAFRGLNFVTGLGQDVSDLFLLAGTDLILGSESTFGSFAAYLGNIKLVKFSREKVDWKDSWLP